MQVFPLLSLVPSQSNPVLISPSGGWKVAPGRVALHFSGDRSPEPPLNTPFRALPLDWHQTPKRPQQPAESEIRQLLDLAYQEALLGKRTPRHLENRHLGAALLLDTGEVLSAHNVFFHHDDVICAERQCLRKAVQRISGPAQKDRLRQLFGSGWALLQQLWHPQSPIPFRRALLYFTHQMQEVLLGRKPKILALAFTAENPLARKDRITAPCSTCLQTLQNEALVSPEMLLLTPDFVEADKPAKSPQTPPQLKLHVRPLSALLPFKNKSLASHSKSPLETLPLQISPQAQAVLNQHLSQTDMPAQIRRTMSTAQTVYQQAITQGRSARNNEYAGCGVLFRSPETGAFSIYTGSSLHATDRERISAVEDAISNALHASQLPVDALRSGLLLLAYVSHADSIVRRLGDLSFLYKLTGRKDILIATLENDTLQVRTLGDCAPILYTKRKDVNGKS